MKQHFRLGLIYSLGVFVALMIWGSVSMYMDAELPNSPIAFTLQRYWFLAWTIISLIFSLLTMLFVAISSLMVGLIKGNA